MYVNDLTKQRLEFPSRKGSLLEEGTIHRWIYLYQILRKYLFSFPFCAPFSTTGTTTDSRQPQGSREILLLPFTSTEVGQRWLYINLGKASGTFTTLLGDFEQEQLEWAAGVNSQRQPGGGQEPSSGAASPGIPGGATILPQRGRPPLTWVVGPLWRLTSALWLTLWRCWEATLIPVCKVDLECCLQWILCSTSYGI